MQRPSPTFFLDLLPCFILNFTFSCDAFSEYLLCVSSRYSSNICCMKEWLLPGDAAPPSTLQLKDYFFSLHWYKHAVFQGLCSVSFMKVIPLGGSIMSNLTKYNILLSNPKECWMDYVTRTDFDQRILAFKLLISFRLLPSLFLLGLLGNQMLGISSGTLLSPPMQMTRIPHGTVKPPLLNLEA